MPNFRNTDSTKEWKDVYATQTEQENGDWQAVVGTRL